MGDTSRSSSIEQQIAERKIFKRVLSWLSVPLSENPKIFLADNAFTYMQPDFYSEEDMIIGEITAHIGKPRKAQYNKLSNDIMKMLLLEKVQNKVYRKIIVVCDTEIELSLSGKSILAESIRQFGIEIKRFEIDDEQREILLQAQARQRMVNGE